MHSISNSEFLNKHPRLFKGALLLVTLVALAALGAGMTRLLGPHYMPMKYAIAATATGGAILLLELIAAAVLRCQRQAMDPKTQTAPSAPLPTSRSLSEPLLLSENPTNCPESTIGIIAPVNGSAQPTVEEPAPAPVRDEPAPVPVPTSGEPSGPQTSSRRAADPVPTPLPSEATATQDISHQAAPAPKVIEKKDLRLEFSGSMNRIWKEHDFFLRGYRITYPRDWECWIPSHRVFVDFKIDVSVNGKNETFTLPRGASQVGMSTKVSIDEASIDKRSRYHFDRNTQKFYKRTKVEENVVYQPVTPTDVFLDLAGFNKSYIIWDEKVYGENEIYTLPAVDLQWETERNAQPALNHIAYLPNEEGKIDCVAHLEVNTLSGKKRVLVKFKSTADDDENIEAFKENATRIFCDALNAGRVEILEETA